MRANEKQHAIRRVTQIAENMCNALVAVKEPSLYSHIVTAVADKNIRLLPSNKIIESARVKIIGGGYGTHELHLSEVFAPPTSYNEELAKYKAEQQRTKNRRDAITREMNRIIDAINFGKITEPGEAIAQMETFNA